MIVGKQCIRLENNKVCEILEVPLPETTTPAKEWNGRKS